MHSHIGEDVKVDRQLVRGIIGLKHRLGMGIWSSHLADELHKPVRKRFQKRSVCAKQVDGIWTADLVDMSPYSISNSSYKYVLTVIDVFSKYGWIVPLRMLILYKKPRPQHYTSDDYSVYKAIVTQFRVRAYPNKRTGFARPCSTWKCKNMLRGMAIHFFCLVHPSNMRILIFLLLMLLVILWRENCPLEILVFYQIVA